MTTLPKKIITNSEKETIKLGKDLAKILKPGDVVGLVGELGSGKTTLIKGILEGLEFDSRNVCSSSFVIIQEYKAKIPVYHIDLYRLDNNFEVYELSWDVYLTPESITLVEWAEKVKELIPFSIKITIKIILDKIDFREIIIEQ